MNFYYLTEGQNLWKKVTIDNVHAFDWFGNPFMPVSISSLLGWHCAVSCDQNPSCKSWCRVEQSCFLTHLIISPLYVPPPTAGVTTKCFTKLESDYIVGSNVTYSSTSQNVPTMIAPNLAKGIFDGIFQRTCGATNFSTIDPWMLFDLGEKKPIREVRIMVQNYVLANDLAHDAQVKIGNSPPATDGDFSTFRHFGQLPTTVVESTTYILKRDLPMKGRYLAIQKLGPADVLVLCHVMAL